MSWPYPKQIGNASGGNQKIVRCPLCKGTGLNPKLITHVCPKCDGNRRVLAP